MNDAFLDAAKRWRPAPKSIAVYQAGEGASGPPPLIVELRRGRRRWEHVRSVLSGVTVRAAQGLGEGGVVVGTWSAPAPAAADDEEEDGIEVEDGALAVGCPACGGVNTLAVVRWAMGAARGMYGDQLEATRNILASMGEALSTLGSTYRTALSVATSPEPAGAGGDDEQDFRQVKDILMTVGMLRAQQAAANRPRPGKESNEGNNAPRQEAAGQPAANRTDG